MSDQERLVAWCPNCGAVGPADAGWLSHPRGCLEPKVEQVDRLTVVRWRRERKRDGWYPEDIDWLVGEVERLRELLGRLEWAGSTQAYQQAFCPVCQRSKLGGHGRACWLAAELRP
jgi:hypothetical protein